MLICIFLSFYAEQISTEYKVLARKHHPDKVADQKEKDKGMKFMYYCDVKIKQCNNIIYVMTKQMQS